MRYLILLLLLTACGCTDKDRCEFSNGTRAFMGQQLVDCEPKPETPVSDIPHNTQDIAEVEGILKEKISNCSKICAVSVTLLLEETAKRYDMACSNFPKVISWDADVELIVKFNKKCEKGCKK